MRLWMIDPKLLCNQHLLGEHSEIHKHRHIFVKHFSITGRIFPIVQIEPASMENRHNELVIEMQRRGFNHNSPYTQPHISYLPVEQQNAKVDLDYNLKDLCNRCEKCKEKIYSKSNIKG
jgi:hypothetical protein